MEEDVLCIPEALVFRPTEEEFTDPLLYIDKIRSQAERIGICRIIPPDGWKPPYQLSPSTTVSSTRVQNLQTLEASARLREDFLTLLLEFNNSQGSGILKAVPKVNGSFLDLYDLYKQVCERGGFRNIEEHDATEKAWEDVAEAMGLIKPADPQVKVSNSNQQERQNVTQQLRQCYQDVLAVFEDDQSEGEKMFSGATMLPTGHDVSSTSTQSSAQRGRICEYRITKKEGTLGLALGDRWGCQVVVTATPNLANGEISPAQTAGMAAGDILLAVAGKNVEGRPLKKVAELLRSAESPVHISVLRQATAAKYLVADSESRGLNTKGRQADPVADCATTPTTAATAIKAEPSAPQAAATPAVQNGVARNMQVKPTRASPRAGSPQAGASSGVNPDAQRSFEFQLQKQKGALGLNLLEMGRQIVVRGLPPLTDGAQSPAEAAGLIVGDVLLAVAGRQVEGLSLKTVADILKSSASPVSIRIARSLNSRARMNAANSVSGADGLVASHAEAAASGGAQNWAPNVLAASGRGEDGGMPVSAAQIEAIALKPAPRQEPVPLQLRRDSDPFGVWEVDALLDLLVDMPDENIARNTMKHYDGAPFSTAGGAGTSMAMATPTGSQLLPAHTARIHQLKGIGGSSNNLRLMGSPKDEKTLEPSQATASPRIGSYSHSAHSTPTANAGTPKTALSHMSQYGATDGLGSPRNGILETKYLPSTFHTFLAGNQYVGATFLKGELKGRVVKFTPFVVEQPGSRGGASYDLSAAKAQSSVNGGVQEDTYKVEFEDGGFEDMNLAELMGWLNYSAGRLRQNTESTEDMDDEEDDQVNKSSKKGKKKAAAAKGRTSRGKKKRGQKRKADDEDEEEDEEDAAASPTKKGGRKRGRPTSGRSPKAGGRGRGGGRAKRKRGEGEEEDDDEEGPEEDEDDDTAAEVPSPAKADGNASTGSEGLDVDSVDVDRLCRCSHEGAAMTMANLEVKDATFRGQVLSDMNLEGLKAQQEQADEAEAPLYDALERQYWRLLHGFEAGPVKSTLDLSARVAERDKGKADGPLSVVHACDLDTAVVGSGFPRRCDLQMAGIAMGKLGAKARPTRGVSEEAQELVRYADDSWNLSNVNQLQSSVLRHVPSRVTGLATPWLHVGSTFSTSSWRSEDHNFGSISYNHTGEPKSWYGVPGGAAEQFERVAVAVAPQLFKAAPELLMHIDTMIDPRELRRRGVPVFRTRQAAGEFVVTFPHAYHSEFNHGFNCSESINVAGPQWLHYGHAGMQKFVRFQRDPVFAHELFIAAISAAAVVNFPREGLRAARQVRTELVKLLDESEQGKAALFKQGLELDACGESGEEEVMQMLNVESTDSEARAGSEGSAGAVTIEMESKRGEELEAELKLPSIGRARSHCDSQSRAYSGRRVVQCSMCRCFCTFAVVTCENAPARNACVLHASTVFEGHPTSQLRIKSLCNVEVLKALRYELDVLIKAHTPVAKK